MRVNNLEVILFKHTKSATLIKHYTASSKEDLMLSVDDIYALEFIVKELKRKLELD